MIEILAKGLEKNVEEAVIKNWYFEEGDHVTEGADLVELATEDSTITITVPAAGILAEVYFEEGETVQRDELICVIDDKEGDLDEDGEEKDEEENDKESSEGEDEEEI